MLKLFRKKSINYASALLESISEGNLTKTAEIKHAEQSILLANINHLVYILRGFIAQVMTMTLSSSSFQTKSIPLV